MLSPPLALTVACPECGGAGRFEHGDRYLGRCEHCRGQGTLELDVDVAAIAAGEEWVPCGLEDPAEQDKLATALAALGFTAHDEVPAVAWLAEGPSKAEFESWAKSPQMRLVWATDALNAATEKLGAELARIKANRSAA